MKQKTIIGVVTLLFAGATFAQGPELRTSYALTQPVKFETGPVTAKSNSRSTARASSSSRGGAAQGVGSQGQSTSIDSHATYQAQARNPVSSALAPAITSSNDTCMGSTSIGASAVSFGFSAGSTWTDENCVMLKNSRELWNMGFKGAALARLCMDPQNKEALESTGITCPARHQTTTTGSGTSANNTSTSSTTLLQADPYRY
ncbi:MAG: hypothetical protein JWM42_3190 [Burkholderia sp.]|jgi:hypothetical protein|nr:hypothetical protein [Burkholderia sp.]